MEVERVDEGRDFGLLLVVEGACDAADAMGEQLLGKYLRRYLLTLRMVSMYRRRYMSVRAGYVVDGLRVGQARAALPRTRPEEPVTQAELAERCGISRVTLNRIENGRARVSLPTVEALARELGCTRDWLLGFNDPVDPIEKEREAVAKSLEKISETIDALNEVAQVLAKKGERIGEAVAA